MAKSGPGVNQSLRRSVKLSKVIFTNYINNIQVDQKEILFKYAENHKRELYEEWKARTEKA